MSQYQPVVSCMPWVTSRPMAWMSLRNTTMPASFCPAWVTPNWLAVFSALTVSAPALARAITSAPEPWACST
ncbi:hypothetical protein D3C86_2048550 [compost metagenome]